MELLTEEEISEFREIFNLVDKDGGGSITGEELGELMDTLGIEASPEEIDAMIREVKIIKRTPKYIFFKLDINRSMQMAAERSISKSLLLSCLGKLMLPTQQIK